MEVTALILLNILEQNICELLLPGFGTKSIIWSNIQLNLILVYPNKNIVNDHVDNKSIYILVIQKKGVPVLCRIGASFKPDIIMVAYKLLILYFNILVYKLN